MPVFKDLGGFFRVFVETAVKLRVVFLDFGHYLRIHEKIAKFYRKLSLNRAKSQFLYVFL